MIMEKQNNTIYYNNEKYIIINSTWYLGKEYLFVINYNNVNDIKVLICLEDLKEVEDIEIIRKIILQMN